MCPSSLSANTHNTKKKCTEDENRKFTVQEGSREGRKRQQSIRETEKYIFGRKVFTTKLLTGCMDKVERRTNGR
jgi:hypothetical protein